MNNKVATIDENVHKKTSRKTLLTFIRKYNDFSKNPK